MHGWEDREPRLVSLAVHRRDAAGQPVGRGAVCCCCREGAGGGFRWADMVVLGVRALGCAVILVLGVSRRVALRCWRWCGLLASVSMPASPVRSALRNGADLPAGGIGVVDALLRSDGSDTRGRGRGYVSVCACRLVPCPGPRLRVRAGIEPIVSRARAACRFPSPWRSLTDRPGFTGHRPWAAYPRARVPLERRSAPSPL